MKIQKLLNADIYRDGGSYGAYFECDDAHILGAFLEVTGGFSVPVGLQHGPLYLFEGYELPDDVRPVRRFSTLETEFLRSLDEFLAAPPPEQAPALGGCGIRDDYKRQLERLREMRIAIGARPPDVVGTPRDDQNSN